MATTLSVYHRFRSTYVRTQQGDLISCNGPLNEIIQCHWDVLMISVTQGSFDPVVVTPSASDRTEISIVTEISPTPILPSSSAKKTPFLISSPDQQRLVIYESSDAQNGNTITGVVLQPSADAADSVFDDVFASLLLKSARLFTSSPRIDEPQPSLQHVYPFLAISTYASSDLKATTDSIVDLFDTHLRYVGNGDKWLAKGRSYFFGRVHEFVRRGAKLEMCLPAFPCKSSNPDKVAGTAPDRGEQLALEHLHAFIEAVEKIYEPGAKLWIVSDGHVFSDCIGVHDDMVDRYNAQLKAMNTAIANSSPTATDRVGFLSLVDLFSLDSCPSFSCTTLTSTLNLPPLTSHIATNRTPTAELSRQILVRGCRTDDSVLRSRIDAGNHSAVALYRGFSRFMLEDLSLNPLTSHLSRSQLKRLASKVSFEMIQRNESYSNLVELLFPGFVRLSIHAHDNGGPKFGIRLFGGDISAREGLEVHEAEMRSVDLLHVPTPWHNCLVEVQGRAGAVMMKSKKVRGAVEEGRFDGGWVEGVDGIAGRYCLRVVKDFPSEASSCTAVEVDAQVPELDDRSTPTPTPLPTPDLSDGSHAKLGLKRISSADLWKDREYRDYLYAKSMMEESWKMCTVVDPDPKGFPYISTMTMEADLMYTASALGGIGVMM